MGSSVLVALDDLLMMVVTSLTLVEGRISMVTGAVRRRKSRLLIGLSAAVGSKDISCSLKRLTFATKKLLKSSAKGRFDEAVGRVLGLLRQMTLSTTLHSSFWFSSHS